MYFMISWLFTFEQTHYIILSIWQYNFRTVNVKLGCCSIYSTVHYTGSSSCGHLMVKVWQLCPISLHNCQADLWRQLIPMVGHFINILPCQLSVCFQAHFEPNCTMLIWKHSLGGWLIDRLTHFIPGHFILIKHWCVLIYFSEVLYRLLLCLKKM